MVDYNEKYFNDVVQKFDRVVFTLQSGDKYTLTDETNYVIERENGFDMVKITDPIQEVGKNDKGEFALQAVEHHLDDG